MKNQGVKFGLIDGVISLIISVISYLTSEEYTISFTSWSFILVMILTLVCMFLASKKTRDQKGGFLTFGEALVPAFVAFAIAQFMGIIFMYVLINHVDPSVLDSITKFGLETQRSTLEMMGATEDQILEQLEKVEETQSNQFTPLGSITNYLTQLLIMGLPISAIIAAIVKKKEPMIQQP